MKKTARRKHHSVRRSATGSSVGTYVVIFLIVVLLILLAKVAVRAFRKPFVLGVQTSQLLAKGDDQNEVEKPEVKKPEDHPNVPAPAPTANPGNPSKEKKDDSKQGNQGSSVGNEVLVDCVGPDSKHFQTSFKDCSELNKAYNKSNFNFTPLTTQTVQDVKQEVESDSKKLQIEVQGQKQEIQQQSKNGAQQSFQIKTENGKSQVNITQAGTTLEIKSENGKTEIHAKKADGTEIQLSSTDAVTKLNDALKEKEIEVEETPDKELVIRKGDVEAETKVPVSVDPITKELSITTPAGQKTVTILPDQAVANLIASKQITSVTQQATNGGANSSQRIALTELNNEPVFQVDGVLNKKVLGIVPVSFAKTSFVSGTTGNVVKTDETLLNKVLEAFSF